MTDAEMKRRLAELSEEAIADIRYMIEQGYGGRGISLEYPATLKQVNAVFELHYKK
jgi:hypothetical protein